MDEARTPGAEDYSCAKADNRRIDRGLPGSSASPSWPAEAFYALCCPWEKAPSCASKAVATSRGTVAVTSQQHKTGRLSCRPCTLAHRGNSFRL